MHTNGQPPERRAADGAPASTAVRPETPLEASLAFRLGRAHRAVRFAWEARIADLHLSSPQASVLRAVTERPGVSLRELARRLHTDPMNAKRIADGLEEAGLLASVDDPADRRRRVIVPTDAGLAISSEATVRAVEWSETLEEILGRDDASRLWVILARIEDGIAALPSSTTAGGERDRG
jgi:DNA-binding MarR family transcriptional regulator